MSFSIRLAQDLTAVEAGATVPLSIEITNKVEEVDRFEMQVEGIDPEWTATPEPVFNVGAHEMHSQKVFFKPPRSSESIAGNYPFVVRVRSLNSGEARTAQGVLEIKAFNHLSMELSPKKGHITPLRKQFSFGLSVMNLGNTEHTLQLSGAEPEEECTFDFESEQVTVGPGQQKEVSVGIACSSGGWIPSTRLYGFVISARSIQNPNVMASTQGQLERRPLLSVPTLATIVVLLGALLLWMAARPQPPTIALYVDSSNIFQGQAVHVRWKANHANSVRLDIRRNIGGKVETPETQSDLQTDGQRDIQTSNEDVITVTAFAVADNNKTAASNPITIDVKPPPLVAAPKILSFKASSTHIRLGDSVILTFDYSDDVVNLVLSPTNQQILPPNKKIEITPSQTGPIEYELFAYNKDHVAASKKLRIDAELRSDAVIVDFSANPAEVVAPDSKTTVSWSVNNAASVQLDDGSGAGLKTVDATDHIDVIIDKTVTLKLVATDAKNVTTSKKLVIKYKAAPPIPVDTTGGTPPPSTGGTATGGH